MRGSLLVDLHRAVGRGSLPVVDLHKVAHDKAMDSLEAAQVIAEVGHNHALGLLNSMP